MPAPGAEPGFDTGADEPARPDDERVLSLVLLTTGFLGLAFAAGALVLVLLRPHDEAEAGR